MKLVIVGDVPYNDAYARAIRGMRDPRIVTTGYITDQDELAELYHNCFVYLHGHEFGGTNPTMLKALAYGCAVGALDTVFAREMLKGGEFGLFFTKDQGSLAGLIEDIERSPERVRELRAKARGRIVEQYTWEKITDQYAQLFARLAGTVTEEMHRQK